FLSFRIAHFPIDRTNLSSIFQYRANHTIHPARFVQFAHAVRLREDAKRILHRHEFIVKILGIAAVTAIRGRDHTERLAQIRGVHFARYTPLHSIQRVLIAATIIKFATPSGSQRRPQNDIVNHRPAQGTHMGAAGVGFRVVNDDFVGRVFGDELIGPVGNSHDNLTSMELNKKDTVLPCPLYYWLRILSSAELLTLAAEAFPPSAQL